MMHIIRSCFLKLSVINSAVIDFGWLAQLVEHLVYTEGVKGSSPLLPTKTSKSGGVAQLVRAIACHAIGRGFESLHSRHFFLFFMKYHTNCDVTALQHDIKTAI